MLNKIGKEAEVILDGIMGGGFFWGWRVEERYGPRGCHDFYTGRDSEGILETIDDHQKAN